MFIQIQEQQKEKDAIEKQFLDVISKKDEEFEQIKQRYEQVMKHRDQEVEKAKIEILKIYTSILRQDRVIEGIENGLYSSTMKRPKYSEIKEQNTQGSIIMNEVCSLLII